MLFRAVIAELLSDVAPMRRISTQLHYQRFLGEIEHDLGDVDMETFTRHDFIEWIGRLRRRKPKRRTFNDYTKFINIVYNFAWHNEYIDRQKKFPMVDGEKERCGRVYSTIEIKAIISALRGSMLLQFIMAYEGFMRLREMLHLTWDRVDLVHKVIVLRKQDVKTGSKCGHGRSIPMSENMHRMLVERRAGALTKWVFPNPYGTNYTNSNKTAWALVKKKAKITGRARWHDIRHTALSNALMELNLPIQHVSRIAGVSIRTLERVYLHNDADQLRIVSEKMNIYKKS